MHEFKVERRESGYSIGEHTAFSNWLSMQAAGGWRLITVIGIMDYIFVRETKKDV